MIDGDGSKSCDDVMYAMRTYICMHASHHRSTSYHANTNKTFVHGMLHADKMISYFEELKLQ